MAATYTLSQAAPQALLPSFNVPVGGKNYFGKMFMPTIGIFIAIGFAVLMWVIINKTTFGYELKACGYNKNAARYAGINEKRCIVVIYLCAFILLFKSSILKLFRRGEKRKGANS